MVLTALFLGCNSYSGHSITYRIAMGPYAGRKVLTFMQEHAWEYLKSTYDCWEACEGVVVSCEAGLIKPDPAIYQHLCDKFAVTAQSCVFVDDMAEDIEAAKAFGIQGVQFSDKHAGGQLIAKIVAERS